MKLTKLAQQVVYSKMKYDLSHGRLFSKDARKMLQYLIMYPLDSNKNDVEIFNGVIDIIFTKKLYDLLFEIIDNDYVTEITHVVCSRYNDNERAIKLLNKIGQVIDLDQLPYDNMTEGAISTFKNCVLSNKTLSNNTKLLIYRMCNECGSNPIDAMQVGETDYDKASLLVGMIDLGVYIDIKRLSSYEIRAIGIITDKSCISTLIEALDAGFSNSLIDKILQDNGISILCYKSYFINLLETKPDSLDYRYMLFCFHTGRDYRNQNAKINFINEHKALIPSNIEETVARIRSEIADYKRRKIILQAMATIRNQKIDNVIQLLDGSKMFEDLRQLMEEFHQYCYWATNCDFGVLAAHIKDDYESGVLASWEEYMMNIPNEYRVEVNKRPTVTSNSSTDNTSAKSYINLQLED